MITTLQNQNNWCTSMDAAYYDLVQLVVKQGFRATPRGQACREVRPAAFSLYDPRSGLYRGASRRLHYPFWAVETLAYIAGWGDERHAALMCALAPRMAQFLDDDTHAFYGAYGPRLAHAMPPIINILRADPNSRQAVVSIWSPDTWTVTRDLPCTLSLSFYATRSLVYPDLDRLTMTAYMRSNDLNWGLPYDVASFCAIQLLVARLVGMTPGPYHHHADSLHLYEASPPTVVAPDEETWASPIVIPDPPPEYRHLSWGHVMERADTILDELHFHRVENDRPLHEFRLGDSYGDSWMDAWAELIRWRWSAWEALC